MHGGAVKNRSGTDWSGKQGSRFRGAPNVWVELLQSSSATIQFSARILDSELRRTTGFPMPSGGQNRLESVIVAHATKLPRLAEALAVLGRRLVVGVADIASAA